MPCRDVRARADAVPVPVALHLDHCPDRELITACLRGLELGAVRRLELDVAENRARRSRWSPRPTATERSRRRDREHAGVEDGVGSDEAGESIPVEVSAEFIAATGVDSFAPAIGNAHGFYNGEPELDAERVTELVAQEPMPIVLHGGTGLTGAVHRPHRPWLRQGQHLDRAEGRLHRRQPRLSRGNPGKHDPLALLAHVRRRSRRWRRATSDVGWAGRGGESGRVGVPALIFDCDGVLADTERHGHLPAFNQTFASSACRSSGPRRSTARSC